MFNKLFLSFALLFAGRLLADNVIAITPGSQITLTPDTTTTVQCKGTSPSPTCQSDVFCECNRYNSTEYRLVKIVTNRDCSKRSELLKVVAHDSAGEDWLFATCIDAKQDFSGCR